MFPKPEVLINACVALLHAVITQPRFLCLLRFEQWGKISNSPCQDLERIEDLKSSSLSLIGGGDSPRQYLFACALSPSPTASIRRWNALPFDFFFLKRTQDPAQQTPTDEVARRRALCSCFPYLSLDD